MTEAELDKLLPSNGYEIVQPPVDYNPIRKQRPMQPKETPFYSLNEDIPTTLPPELQVQSESNEIPLKAHDYQFFGKVFNEKTDDELTPDEVRERKILSLLLKIKNGTPQVRRQSLKYYNIYNLIEQLLKEPEILVPVLCLISYYH